MLYTLFYFFFFFLNIIIVFFFFFFSSRRRHTRCLSDWSSDVCSSDLGKILGSNLNELLKNERIIQMLENRHIPVEYTDQLMDVKETQSNIGIDNVRSEERRVGKE